jgi:hypothetical protein
MLNNIKTDIIKNEQTGKRNDRKYFEKYSNAIHTVFSLTTDPQPLPELVLHRVRSSASYLNFQYPLFSFSSSNRILFLFLVFPSFLTFSFFQLYGLEGSSYARCDQRI